MFEREKPPMCLSALGQPLATDLWERGRAMYRILKVFSTDARIQEFLQKNDPKANEQLAEALEFANADRIRGGQG